MSDEITARSPTICLMLKAPLVGTVKTRLAAQIGAGAACTVYRRLAEKQLARMRGMDLEVHFTPASGEAMMRTWLGGDYAYIPQVEGDLGARMAHATDGALGRGGSGAILLGGDCPGVSTEVLAAAGAKLKAHDVVLGPATDGGYYLLALKAGHDLFEGIEWSTPSVLPQTRDRIRQLGLTCHLLPELEDVDDLASLERARLTHPFLR